MTSEEGKLYLLPELAANMAKSLLAVKAQSLEATIPKHFCDLGILLPLLAEGEFSLHVIVLVLSATAIFTALYLTKI